MEIYRTLADLVRFAHIAFFLACARVFFSGKIRRSILHLKVFSGLIISVPVLDIVFGGCPLTILENALRSKYDPTYDGGTFIGGFAESALGITVTPEHLFCIICIVVATSVAISFSLIETFGRTIPGNDPSANDRKREYR